MASGAFLAGSGTRSSTGVDVVSQFAPDFGGSSLAFAARPRFLNWSVMRQRVRFNSQALNEPNAGSALNLCMLLHTDITASCTTSWASWWVRPDLIATP